MIERPHTAIRQTAAAVALLGTAALSLCGCRQGSSPAADPASEARPAVADRAAELDDSPTVSEVQSRIARHQGRREAWLAAIQSATDDERAKLNSEFFAYLSAAIDDMLAVATVRPRTQGARAAALWVITACDADHPPHRKAAEILLEHHASASELGAVCGHLQGFHPIYERLLRACRQSATDESTQGLASLALADLLLERADFQDVMAATPENDKVRQETMGREIVEYLAAADRNRDRSEAQQLYRIVQREYGDVVLGDGTLGKLAADRLLPFEQTFVQIGQRAPEIDGDDLQGQRFTLADHRGKVVVVVFWASWCGPCLARIPEENALLDELRDQPFALVGVSSDMQRDDAVAAAKKHQIAFRSWWDDPQSSATIAARWRVTEWPTTFVLDREGTIRYRGLHGPELRQAALQLLRQ